MELNLGKLGATRQSWSRDSVRVAYLEVRTENPKATHAQMVRLLGERSLEDDELRTAGWDYIVTACENAQVGYEKTHQPTPPVKSEEVRRTEKQQDTAKIESIKDQVFQLNREMANGKRMRYCTGAEMAKFGKGYARIAKKVGSTKMVGSVLNEQQVRALLK